MCTFILETHKTNKLNKVTSYRLFIKRKNKCKWWGASENVSERERERVEEVKEFLRLFCHRFVIMMTRLLTHKCSSNGINGR